VAPLFHSSLPPLQQQSSSVFFSASISSSSVSRSSLISSRVGSIALRSGVTASLSVTITTRYCNNAVTVLTGACNDDGSDGGIVGVSVHLIISVFEGCRDDGDSRAEGGMFV
jgi:hypothetical protein